MDEATIFALAGVEYIERSGLRLLGTRALLHLLPYLEQQGLAVLGLEGFQVAADGLEPDMNLIADFSKLAGLPSEERSSQSIRETRAFLAANASREIYFEVTITGLE